MGWIFNQCEPKEFATGNKRMPLSTIAAMGIILYIIFECWYYILWLFVIWWLYSVLITTIQVHQKEETHHGKI